MKVHSIGIGCIGSGVGQSVVNSLRLSRLPVRTVGFGTNPFAFGAYDCHAYDSLPSIHDEEYIDVLIARCHAHSIELLIPGLDEEALLFARNAKKFSAAGIKAIVADERLVEACNNKENLGAEFSKHADVFVKSFTKSAIMEEAELGRIRFPLIAKPRRGSGSRGIKVLLNADDLLLISDDHVIQEMAIPQKSDPHFAYYLENIQKRINPQVSEISIQLVYNHKGDLLGRMASCNKLKNGIPIEIIPIESESIWAGIDPLSPTLLEMGLRGPLNFQGRLTEKGLRIFEMNPRFTGITGLRALMGFNEVEACVKEWLGIDPGKNKLMATCNRFGMRQISDKSVPIKRNDDVFALAKKINGAAIKRKKTLLITGACGYLGQNLICELSKNNAFEIWAFDLSKERTEELFAGKVQACFDCQDLANGLVRMGNVDILLHLGFAREYCGNREISASLEFAHELFTRAATHQIPAILNISSQSVYGVDAEPLWKESTPVSPATAYAQAKYSTELLLRSLKKINNHMSHSSLRLGALAGGARGLREVDFLSKIVRKAFAGEAIKLIGGHQQIERLDIRDAVSAISTMLDFADSCWQPVYNLGSGEINSLSAIAKKVIETAPNYNGGIRSEIHVEKKHLDVKCGMDSSLFYKEMKWQPKYKMSQMIESLLEYFKDEKAKTKTAGSP